MIVEPAEPQLLDDVAAEPQKKRDTVSLLTVYLFFLMAIPSSLVIGALGGAGAPSNLLGVVFLFIYLARYLHPSFKVSSERLRIRLATTLLLCTFLASYIAGNIHAMSTLDRNGADRGIIMVSGWLGIVLLTTDGINSMERFRTLLDRMVYGATGIAIIGIIQFFTGKNLAGYITVPGLISNTNAVDTALRGSFNRPQATAIHPIEFGYVLCLILPIAIHRARHAPKDRRLIRWLEVGLIAGTLPLTVSRSAILGLVIVAIVIIPTWPTRERLVAIGIILTSVLGLGVAVHGILRTFDKLFTSMFNGSSASTTSRTGAFSSAMPFISKHPFLGTGFGTFQPQIYFYTDNEYLNAAIEIGLVGVAVLLALFITGWFTARRTRKISADPEIKHLAQCLAASCGAIIAVSGTFDMLYFAMAAGATFLTLGCIGALYRLTLQDNARCP